jgi:uncharacterized protein (DUF433 family)
MAVGAHKEDPNPQMEFPHIAFRDSATGRQAYLRGHRLGVWQIASASRSFDGNVQQVAHHFRLETGLVEEALAYAAAHPQEIEAELRYAETFDIERLRTFVPNARLLEYRDTEHRQ